MTPAETEPQAAMNASLRAALKPVEGPLTYGRRNAQALSSLRGLEALAQRGLEQTRGLSLPMATSSLLPTLVEAAAAFDRADTDHRSRAFELLHLTWSRLVGESPMPTEASPPLPTTTPAPAATQAANVESTSGRPRVRSLSAEGSLAPASLEGEVLQRPLSSLRGIGPAVAEKLGVRGLRTLGDALLYLPRQYEDRRETVTIQKARPGQKALLRARIVSFDEKHVRRTVYELVVEDDTGSLTARWFGFKPGAYRAFLPGTPVVLSGEVRSAYRGGKEITHPDLELGEAADDPASFGHVIPVYTEVEGVSARFYRRIARQVVDACRGTPVDEFYGSRFRQQHDLVTLGEALSGVHFPPDDVDFQALSHFSSPGQRRLVFDELFFVQLGLALRKRGVEVTSGLPMRTDDAVMQRALRRLPFTPTRAQRRALDDVAKDLAKNAPMSRLLQGDVGSGKTAVALAAAMLAVENGYQAAVMAPTELLAEQHARTFEKLLGGGLFQKRDHDLPPVHTVLLSAGRSAKELKRSLNEVESGTARIVVGTHALLSEGVKFHNLGLAVIDEQHRFGVLQRAQLMSKGKASPHVLVMTATPIPRTLALTLYGDLDVSVIDELPPGRTPVTTKAFSARTRAKAYDVIRREVEAGHQAYVVLPLVEESDKIDLRSAVAEFERLGKEELSGLSLGLVHGRMSPEERTAAMDAFRLGRTQVLVATTVIEVGVDVPNASVMLIEHAERFGLSQLHQLRGRVGRGAAKSYCLLVHEDDKASSVARRRLEVMVRTADGFKLSESDLEIRGPGEFLGTRQSGLPDLVVADLLRDQAILREARDAAFDLVRVDPELRRPEHAGISKELSRRWAEKMSLARIG